MEELKRVALYARFSSESQRTEYIDAQIRAMRQYCRDNRWKIVGMYIDEARSATTDRCPNYQRMIEDSSKKLFDIVLVHKLDRFSRNRNDSAIYKNKLKCNGVAVCLNAWMIRLNPSFLKQCWRVWRSTIPPISDVK